MATKTCVVCGAEFKALGWRSTVCGRQCRLKMAANLEAKKRAERRFRGVCVLCATPLAPASTVYCVTHLLKQKVNAREYARRRNSCGQCRQCGQPLAVTSRCLC